MQQHSTWLDCYNDSISIFFFTYEGCLLKEFLLHFQLQHCFGGAGWWIGGRRWSTASSLNMHLLHSCEQCRSSDSQLMANGSFMQWQTELICSTKSLSCAMSVVIHLWLFLFILQACDIDIDMEVAKLPSQLHTSLRLGQPGLKMCNFLLLVKDKLSVNASRCWTLSLIWLLVIMFLISPTQKEYKVF